MWKNNNYKKLRESFNNFFTQRGYVNLPSSNLIVENDPSLLFTSAGMVQFKDVFLKLKPRQVKRAITIQKCLRVGGKHNDLDNVGFTNRHNTFFEMIGHFSFYDNDYSKEKIIRDAFEFLTEQCGLDKRKFWITVDIKDQESCEIWEKILPKEKIILESSGENFWSMGDVGPCGPCTEILYDKFFHPNEEVSAADVLRDSERFLEVWNIVFMCQIKTANGIQDMQDTSIDTGMGLERLLSIMENVSDSFATSIFKPLMDEMQQYLSCETPQHVYRICADHLRTAAFLLGEGLEMSNGKHGYILKKIIRRAVFYYYPYHKGPLLYKILPKLREIMGEFHPDILCDTIDKQLKYEEEKNISSLDSANDIIKKNINKKDNSLSGKDVFYLYDTCGINLNLLQEYAHTNTIQLDLKGFDEEMSKQKLQSGQKILLNEDMETEFIGYEYTCKTSVILGLYTLEGEKIPNSMDEDSFLLFSQETPFFPESGGQVGDGGYLSFNNKRYEIQDTQYYNTPNGLAIGHRVLQSEGNLNINLKVGDSILLQINEIRRLNTAKNHSATHLLDSAISELTGKNQQKGSKVYHDRFRLDFTAGRVLTKEDLPLLEEKINQIIRKDIATEIKTIPFQQAINEGYLFMENFYYGENVRVINLGNGFSKALCCGTHVRRTGEISGIKITKMRLIRSNTYRIEGISGAEFLNYTEKSLGILRNLSQILDIKFDIYSDSVEYITGIILRSASPFIAESQPKKNINNLQEQEILVYKYLGKEYSLFMGRYLKIQLNSYDLEKNKNNFVLFLEENNGILIGSEHNREILPLLVQHINESLPLKGGGAERLFRGKIINSNDSNTNYNLLKKLFNCE